MEAGFQTLVQQVFSSRSSGPNKANVIQPAKRLFPRYHNSDLFSMPKFKPPQASETYNAQVETTRIENSQLSRQGAVSQPKTRQRAVHAVGKSALSVETFGLKITE